MWKVKTESWQLKAENGQLNFHPTATREHQSGNEVVSEDTANQILY
jgi:hypothetical protein